MSYDPAFLNTANCKSSITFIDGDVGILEYRGYPIDQLAEKSTHLEVSYLRDERRAAQQGPARGVHHQDHPPHVRAREHQVLHGRVPVRRAPDVDAGVHGGGALELLPRGQEREEPRGPPPADDAAHREDAHPRGVLVPPQPGAAVRLPEQRSRLHRELPHDGQEHRQAELAPAPGAGEGARPALHPPRRPRAELLHHRDPRRGQLRSRPVLGGRGGHHRPLRPAPRRRQRGRAAHAARDRRREERPRVHRPREGRRRHQAHGLRSPRLQELRSPREGDQEGVRRGLRGHRQEPRCSRSPSSSSASPCRTSTSSSASSTRTSISTRA